mgnify:CR=1 FL=1
MKWSTEAKVGAFALAGILLFAGILIELSSLVIFGKSGFHVTGYFKEAEGIEPEIRSTMPASKWAWSMASR